MAIHSYNDLRRNLNESVGYFSESLDEKYGYYQPEIDGGLQVAYEIEENFMKFNHAVMLDESAYYKRYGEEMVYNEAEAGGFIETAINFLKSIKEKIVGLYKKFMLNFKVAIGSDEAFVAKYRDKVKGSIEYKGFEFTLDAWKADSAFSEIQSVIFTTLPDSDISTPEACNKVVETGYDENFENEICGASLNSRKSVGKKRLHLEAAKLFRDGKEEPEDIMVDLKDALKTVSLSKRDANDVTKVVNKVQDEIDSYIKGLKNLKKSVDRKNSDKVAQAANVYIKAFKHASWCMDIVFGEYMKAIKAANSQAKKCVIKGVKGTAGEDKKADTTDKTNSDVIDVEPKEVKAESVYVKSMSAMSNLVF